MLNKNKYKQIYRTHKDSIDQDFYVPCFCESVRLDRAAGFFSLHSLVLSIDGIIRFIKNNGQINIICSPDLSQEDAELIDACVNLDENHVKESLLDTITYSKLSTEEACQLDIICNMLVEGKLVIKIAFQPLGIFHEKFGIFTDRDNNKVYFNGSLNETKRAFVFNQESIRVNCSWQSLQDKVLIDNEQQYFYDLWNNEEDSIVVIDFPEAVEQKLLTFYKRSETLKDAIDNYISSQIHITKKILFSYQEEAIKQFCENGYYHFYEMATGTGKTFTAIKTIQRLKRECPEKKLIVILVPQVDLQEQWNQSLQEEGYCNNYLLGGLGTAFERTIAQAIIAFHTQEEDVICIAVYDTFFSKVVNEIQNISPLFVIVDEAHNLTPVNLSLLKKINPKYKLGLSATIQRFNKDESQAIAKFFTPKHTFYYGIEDAIENNFLSEYEYHPIFVRLSEDETDKFQKKTKALAVEMNKEEKDQNKRKIEDLRRERSLILKQASGKITKLKELADCGYDFVNSVVYCGQGKDEEGDAIIDTVTKTLYESGLVVSQFTSKSIDRKKILYEFEHGYFDTLAAIRCFDEGVDVPKLDKIYIMASDSSPRQTVQRRGRVLRKCKESGKTIAYIYDMVVLPAIEAGTYGFDGLLNIEFARAREYNRLAINKDRNDKLFCDIENTYHIALIQTEDYEQ